MPSVKKPDEIRNLLEGPVNSIPTTFLPNGQLDWEGIGRIIDVGIASGSKVSLLTYGDSQFEFLSDEEVAQLTRFLVDRVAGRALTVAATRRWPDDRAVQFAEYCRSWGADLLMVLPPEQAQSQGKVVQYRKVAQVMPLMLVGCPPYEILDELLDAPNICTFKEDGTLEYAKATMHRYGDRWKFMTGGGLWRNFAQWPCGIRAFFCYPSSFAPHIAQSYWRAFQDGDAKTAQTIITQIEEPFWGVATDVVGGGQAVWRTALELNGIASRWLRPPMVTATDEEVEKIGAVLDAIGLINPL